ncbi:Uncharacterised protein [Bordetella pertussis]|nr:Uncharacterised protein [Bordetella pertussis]CPJ72224.1 Uncharacterised protein [Bordetella pertussis]CPK95191.1 Uncharacterised protein [Bordetella pertussis]CPL23355.1 Uncharacterised protein [Bordetella pertussis]CPL39244.1 Uncharacterised protein [Bordetella pertussis]
MATQQGIAAGQRQARGRGAIDLGAHRRVVVQLGHHARQRAGPGQHIQHARRRLRHQPARHFFPDPLGHQRIGLAGLDHAAAQLHGFRRDAEVAKARGKTAQTQDAHRVLGEGLAHVAQHAGPYIGHAIERVDQFALRRAGDRIDRQVAPLQVLLQRNVGAGVEGEPLVAASRLAFGARQRVFLFRARMQEHGEIAAHRDEAAPRHVLGRGAHHDPVAIAGRQAKQVVAHRAADDVDPQPGNAWIVGPAHRWLVARAACGGTMLPRRSFSDCGCPLNMAA